jgi:hypothetical protein
VALPAGVGQRGARTAARPASPRLPSREIPLEDLDSPSPTAGAASVSCTGRFGESPAVALSRSLVGPLRGLAPARGLGEGKGQ